MPLSRILALACTLHVPLTLGVAHSALQAPTQRGGDRGVERVTGRTGNQILAATRAAAEREGITCCVYTHPLGFYCHASGPTIGMLDEQGPTPVRGDWPLHPSTCYAIEGNVTVPIPEWGGQRVQIKLEQDAVFDGERVLYLGGRQTRFHLIR